MRDRTAWRVRHRRTDHVEHGDRRNHERRDRRLCFGNDEPHPRSVRLLSAV